MIKEGLGQLWDWKRPSTRIFMGLAVLSGLAWLVALVAAPSWARSETGLIAALVPGLFAVLTLRRRAELLLVALVVSLSFSARLRPESVDFHSGGAELAVAALDFPLIGLWLLILIAGDRERWQALGQICRPLAWAFAAYGLVHLPAWWGAADPGLAALEVLRVAKMGLLVVALIWHVRSRDELGWVLWALLFTVLAQGGLAIAQRATEQALGLGFLGEHPYWQMEVGGARVGRPGGTLGHANALACFMSMLTPLALVLTLGRSSYPWRLVAGLATLGGALASLFSFSRAGWLGLATGVVVALTLYWRRRAIPWRVLGWVALAFLILGGGFVALSWSDLQARFANVQSTSLRFRISTARVALNMWQQHPWFGIGPNNYEAVSADYVTAYRTWDGRLFRPWNAELIVHNIWLLYAAEMGLVGLMGLGLLMGATLWRGIQWARRAAGDLAPLAAGITGGVAGMLAQNMLGWSFRYDPIHTLFWFLLALLLIAHALGQPFDMDKG